VATPILPRLRPAGMGMSEPLRYSRSRRAALRMKMRMSLNKNNISELPAQLCRFARELERGAPAAGRIEDAGVV
jgi:hypothetical protein